jgi:metallo-beta-lactamase family protein
MVSYLPGSSAGPTVTFWGAARTVTGSMHLVAAGGRKLLLDCGAARGAWHEVRRRNGSFPFHAVEVDAVILSHAHSDHCGNLPVLVRHGFTGPIYCTPATRDLIAVMLADSARVKEEDSRIVRVLDQNTGAEPLYSREDVVDVMRQCVSVPYDEPREILPGTRLRLLDAGHLLGAAMVSLRFQQDGRESSLTFTGDLGRRGVPLVADPAPVPAGDLLICESTYGGRTHQPMDQLRAALSDTVRRTVERGGKVLVPAFSLGRTQTVVHTLQEEMRAGQAPCVPIFVDSPLAAQVADVYRRHLNLEAPDQRHAVPGLLEGEAVRFIRNADESRDLSRRREPCIVVASGGMCEGGRILQHLKHHIDDPRCAVALVSFQAPGTPGRQLLDRGPTVRFHGRKWNKWAEIVDLNGFSGHADHADLLAQLSPLMPVTRKVCLVHGELERAEALQAALLKRGFGDVLIPAEGQIVSI